MIQHNCYHLCKFVIRFRKRCIRAIIPWQVTLYRRLLNMAKTKWSCAQRACSAARFYAICLWDDGGFFSRLWPETILMLYHLAHIRRALHLLCIPIWKFPRTFSHDMGSNHASQELFIPITCSLTPSLHSRCRIECCHLVSARTCLC